MKTKTFLGGAVVGLCIGVGLSSLYWSRELLQSYIMTIDANGRTYAQAEKTLSELETKHQVAANPIRSIRTVEDGIVQTRFECRSTDGFDFTAPSSTDLSGVCQSE